MGRRFLRSAERVSRLVTSVHAKVYVLMSTRMCAHKSHRDVAAAEPAADVADAFASCT
jgi:hypothetical protein